MIKGKLAPSMICAGFFELRDTLRVFERAGVEYLHIDIMDGHFVNNYTLGTDYVKALKGETDIPLDVHLMIEDPEDSLDWFEFGEGDYVSVHVEATRHLQRALARIRDRGGKPMAAINPATPISALEEVLDYIDGVLVMTVNPGFTGQRLVGSTLNKLSKLRRYLDDNGYEQMEVEVDGNVSFENAVLMRRAGANIFVGGTSSVFAKGSDIPSNLARLRSAIE